MTPSKWIETTGAIGITTKAGRYNGGTYMESYNALLIEQQLSQLERLHALRAMAIKQLQTLSALDVTGLPQLLSSTPE